MKNLIYIFIVLFSINSYAQTVTLTVNDGFGGGVYNTGDSVFVLANPTPDNFVFEGWQTNTVLTDTFCVATMVKNITSNTVLTPLYSTAPSWTEAYDTINGSNVYYYFPTVAANLKGLILFFHGSGGNGGSWFSKFENRTFLNYAVAKGYAVLSTESVDRITGGTPPWQWSNSPTVSTNIDIQNIDNILDTMNASGFINTTTKIYGVGFSQGSNFTSIISALKNYTANSLGSTPGANQAIAVTLSPTYWMSSRQDLFQDPLRLQKCITNYDTLVSRGIDAELHIHEPFPVTPNRFWRIPTIDSAMSYDIYNRLITANYLDNQHFVNFNPFASSAWTSIMQPTYNLQVGDIEDQINICYTEHKFHSDQMYYIIKFFDRYANNGTTGITNFLTNNSVAVYPNPTTSELNIPLPLGSSFTTEVVNALGETVLKNQNDKTIDISKISHGFYFVKIYLNNKTYTSKFIKQ